MATEKYDFSGWATKNNLRCSDGLVICKDAFKENDGQTVPLFWNHQHNDPTDCIGHALLKNEAEGVKAYCSLNDSYLAQHAKLAVEHGDITALSIYANQLKKSGNYVQHGCIREVSLVLAGANPGAFIDSSSFAHSEDGECEEGIIYTDEELELQHSDDEGGKKEMAEDTNKKAPETDSEETVEDVINTMSEKQKTVMYALIGQALQDAKGRDDSEDDEEEENVKHNVFDKDEETMAGTALSHSDEEAIVSAAKKTGSFQDALEAFADDNGLEHSALTPGGFPQTGDGNVGLLFPDYKDVRPGAPELVTSDQGWISVVMNKVHKSPISRIRTGQVDIRNIDALRAKGYTKGKEKTWSGNFKLVRRTTDPQTIYVKNMLYRDDIIDITDFDYVSYLYNIDRMMLNEEIATAIMFGDGRDDGDENKISPEHIRPIWLDDDLYTIHTDLDIATAKKELQGTNTAQGFGDNYIYAEAVINTMLYARETFKGTGTPDMFLTPHSLNVMLLARDLNGRRIYSSKAELASAFNVGNVYTVEQMENKVRTTSDSKKKKIFGLVCNLADYSLGATKGGEITHFTDFDIDFNAEKSLIETRCSGALTRIKSAIVLEEDVTTGTSGAAG